jgi:aspartyl-tRNA(Asn)/glutamyl-tRNA(Gln) amidotransferase subunit C
MKIDQENLQKIAHLARLNFDAQAGEKMSADLSQVLNWVEQLQEVDTEGVAPLTNMSMHYARMWLGFNSPKNRR